MSLFNRVLRGRSPQPQVDPHSWKFPSSYSTPKPGAKQTVIPNPSIFGNAIIPDKPKTSNLESSLLYPDVSHAAVHLALLECFWNLRLSASSLDVDVTKPPEYEEKAKTHSATPTKLLESQRWDLLISLAVTRFEVWWSKIDQVINHAMAYSHHSGKDVAVQLSKDQLPPLDVLMVWYALILNEDAYDRACTGNPRNQQLCFPWPAIRECIDMEKMQYSVPRSAQILFTTLSTQSSDILAYLEQPPAYMDSPPLSLEIDLAAQVKSNEDFITEAHSLLWIRAPSLRGSLDRASASYMEFQVQRGPTHMIKGHVPFGIHLIWRTHRLFPNFYKLFADEVEKISKREGVDGKAADSEKLAPASNAQMRICECWICERIRDDIPTYVSHQPGSSGSSGSPSQTSRDSPISSLSSSALKQIQDDIGFYEAVEAARRRGDSALPTRPPTAAEKAAEKILQDRQKAVGYRPGLHEYWEIQPDGTRKIKRQKNIHGYGTSGIWALGAMDI